MPPYHYDFDFFGTHRQEDAVGPSRRSAKWRLRSFTAADFRHAVRTSPRTLLSQLRPQGGGTCDHTQLERVANLLTSFLYIDMGMKAMQSSQGKNGKAYGLSICGAGVGSLAFHSTSGKWREWGRRLDYWAIGVSTACLQRVLDPGLPKWVTGASLLATPFRPFVVSAANTTALELRYAVRAKQRPTMRRNFVNHVGCGAAGMACFYLEERHPDNPCIHPAWHVLAALSVNSIRPLIEDIEQQNSQAGVPGSSEKSPH